MKSFTRATRLSAIQAKRASSPNATKLAMFIRCQMAAGTSHEKAWEQARRLNICGIND